MNTSGWTILAAPCVALAALTATSQQLQRVQDDASARRVAAQDQDDASTWRDRLASADLSAREADFEALVARAAEDKGARARLEEWANDYDHREFAWTCRLALREVKAREQSQGAPGLGGDPFEALRQRMFSGQFGADPFGGMIAIDPFGQGFGGLQDWSMPFDFQPGSGAQSQGESFTFEMGPDGVKARVKKNDNGQESEEEYSAKSLDELLQAHPELGRHLGRGDNNLPGLRMFQFGGRDKPLALRGFARPVPTDKLGVYVAEDAAAGEGIKIAGVQPGSLADELGLQPGQVLLSLNGRELKTRDDFSKVLRERAADQGIEVRVKETDGSTITRSWSPPAPSEHGAAHPLAPHGTRKI